MKITLLLLVIVAHCAAGRRSFLRQATPEPDEDNSVNDDDLFNMIFVTPASLLPRDFMDPTTTTTTPAPETLDRKVLSQGFVQRYSQFANECMLFGCQVCTKNTGMGQQCRRVPGRLSVINPYMGSFGFRNSQPPVSELLVKQHGFLEVHLIFTPRRGEAITYKLTMIELAEAIKNVMVAKDKIVACVPELVLHEPEPYPDPVILSEVSDRTIDRATKYGKKIMEKGGFNFCIGKAQGNAANCMIVDWNPVCHNVSSEYVTLTFKRNADSFVETISSPEGLSEIERLFEVQPSEISVRVEKTDVEEARKAVDEVRQQGLPMMPADPVTVDQVFELTYKLFDFVGENAFRP